MVDQEGQQNYTLIIYHSGKTVALYTNPCSSDEVEGNTPYSFVSSKTWLSTQTILFINWIENYTFTFMMKLHHYTRWAIWDSHMSHDASKPVFRFPPK